MNVRIAERRSAPQEHTAPRRRAGRPAAEPAARPAAARPPRLTARARRDWRDLEAPSEPTVPFAPEMTAGLPAPARRWLNHAIRPGTPLLAGVRLGMRGRIRLGSWWPFQATQILRPPYGFVWAATARIPGLPISGFDRYSGGDGEMRRRLFGVLPAMSASGPDITRSAAGRLASELVFAPAAALAPSVTWEAVDDVRVRAHMVIDGRDHPVTLSVAPDGALIAVSLPRWGDPGGGRFGEYVFSVIVQEEAEFGGYTIPGTVSGGWASEPGRGPGEFIRFTIDHARHY